MSRFTVVLFFLLVFVAGPAAAGKFDLTPYFGPIPTVGDFRVFELSTGGMRTIEVVEVSLMRKSLRVLNQTTETGMDPVLTEAFLIPGKALLFGNQFAAGYFVDLKKPATLFKFKAKPGKANKIRAKGNAFVNGAPAGKAKYGGSWAFAGLEPLDTPTASYPDTAVLQVVLTFVVKNRVSGNVEQAIVESVLWNARGLGEVARRHRATSWVNGILVSDTGWIKAWLIDGSLAGQPIP